MSGGHSTRVPDASVGKVFTLCCWMERFLVVSSCGWLRKLACGSGGTVCACAFLPGGCKLW